MVSCGFMSKLQGDKKYRLFLAVPPEVAIEYVDRQGRLAGCRLGIASVYVDYVLFSLLVKRFSTSTDMTSLSIARLIL